MFKLPFFYTFIHRLPVQSSSQPFTQNLIDFINVAYVDIYTSAHYSNPCGTSNKPRTLNRHASKKKWYVQSSFLIKTLIKPHLFQVRVSSSTGSKRASSLPRKFLVSPNVSITECPSISSRTV